MEEQQTDLLRLIPPDARVVVELNCSDGELGTAFRRINPSAQYFGIATNADGDRWKELPVTRGQVDCIVYRAKLPLANLTTALSECYAWLHPDGQLLAQLPNLQYWRRLVKLLRGKWDDEGEWLSPEGTIPLLTIEKIKETIGRCGFHLYEVQTRYPAMDEATQQQFERFAELIEPLATEVGWQFEQFKIVSRSLNFIVRALRSPLQTPKLLVQTVIAAPVGCDRVRVLEPDRFLGTIPGTRTVSHQVREPIMLNIGQPGEEKVFVWQRALLYHPQDIAKQKAILQRGYLIVMEHDDDPYHWPENLDNKFLIFWTSHCLQTSTEPLAELLKQFNPNVVVFRNHLAQLPPPRAYKRDDVTVFFGALNRQKDWESILPAINRVLSRHPQVNVQVIHDREFYEALTTANKQFRAWCDYDAYQAVLHQCDIGILPLLDTRFNRMKSDLKFLEHAGHGAVALASPTVYGDSIVDGETGVIYRTVEEFESKFEELIRNADLRHRLAGNAYNWVRETRLLSQHYRARRDWYLEMRSQLPRLNAELRDRCPEMFE